MADVKITALGVLTAADPINDAIPIVDVSDPIMAASGTTKRISINNILGASGTATLASATITGALTVDTTTLVVNPSGYADRVGIGTATPAYAADVSVATTDGLRVKNTLATSAYFNRFHISNDTGINFIGYGASYAGGTILGLGAGSNSIFSDSAAPFGITTTVNQPLVFGINGSTAMTLNSIGLGVGGIVTGTGPTILVEGTAGTYAKFNSKVGAKTWSAGYRSGTLQFEIQEDSTERFVIANGGNVGIGVTPTNIAGQTRVEIKGSGSGNLTLRTASGNAAARDWQVACNLDTFGELNFRQGASAGADPNSGTTRMVLDASGNLILLSSATPSTLGTNGMLTVNATSNTNLRFSYRGSDGTTRVANITLA